MHPRQIPTFLAVGLIAAGIIVLLLPYRVEGRAGSGPLALELTASCPSPVVDTLKGDAHGWSVKDAPSNRGVLFSANPGPCDSNRVERGFAGLALVAGGVALLAITGRRRRARERADAVSPQPR